MLEDSCDVGVKVPIGRLGTGGLWEGPSCGFLREGSSCGFLYRRLRHDAMVERGRGEGLGKKGNNSNSINSVEFMLVSYFSG